MQSVVQYLYLSKFINNNTKSLQFGVGAPLLESEALSRPGVCASLTLRHVCTGSVGRQKVGCCGFQTGWPTSFPSRRGVAALPGKPRSWFSLARDWWQKPVCWSGEEGWREPHGTGFTDAVLPRERARTTPHTHNPARKIKDQNVVSSEINSPVPSVWGGRAHLVYIRFSWVFPLQVCQHTAWYKVTGWFDSQTAWNDSSKFREHSPSHIDTELNKKHLKYFFLVMTT